MRAFIITLLRGIGQVMFQNNALSGLLMLIGIFLNSWQMGLLALFGSLIGTLTAHLLRYSKTDIEDGLYGFNGTLVGIATGVFFHITPLSLILSFIFTALSTPLARLFRRQTWFGGYTAPFILMTWLMLGLAAGIFPELYLSLSSSMPKDQAINPLDTFFLSFGQIMFQGGTILSGILFLLAFLINSPKYTYYAVWGALLANLTALCYGTDYSTLNFGLMGYNAVLAAMAIGDKSVKSFLLASAAVLLSVFFQLIGMDLGLITLTSPFVLSVWLIELPSKLMKKGH